MCKIFVSAIWLPAFPVAGPAQVTVFSIPTPDGGPGAITRGWDGNLWFTEFRGNKIGRIATADGVITEFPLPAANDHVGDITTGPDGNLWFDWGHQIGASASYKNIPLKPLTPLYTRIGRLLYAQISIRTTLRQCRAATSYPFSSPRRKPTILRR